MNGAFGGSTAASVTGGGVNASTATDRIDETIRRNDKNAKKVCSLQAKVMHQRDIHSKRLRDFMNGAMEKLRGIQQNVAEEMDTTLRQRQDELADLHIGCMNRALELRSIKDRGGDVTAEELSLLLEDMAKTEQLIESLGVYDLVISPQMVGFLEAMHNESKPAYIRTSPLFPLHVELSLVEISRQTSTLVFTALPQQPESRLSTLLAGTMVKLQIQNGNTVADPDSTIEGAITAIPGRRDGGCEVTFVLPEANCCNVDGDYLVKVTIYGRQIKNSPMKVRLNSGSNLDEMLGVPRRSLTVDDTPPPLLTSANIPANVSQAQSRNQAAAEASQASTETWEVPSQARGAPDPAVIPPPPLFTDGASALLDLGMPQPQIDQAQPRTRLFVGVGRGRPLVSGPTAADVSSAMASGWVDGSTSIQDAIQEMDEFFSEVANTTVKPVPEKDTTIEPSSAPPNVRMPRGISATESIVAAAGRLTLDDNSGPSRGNRSPLLWDVDAVSRMALGREPLEQESLRRSVNTFEESAAMAQLKSGAGAVGGILRADLTGLLGDEHRRKDIRGTLVARFGREKREEPPDQCFSFPIGCTKDEATGEFIICDTRHHTVKIFDGGANLKQINRASFLRPAAVVTLDDKRYAIRDDKSIQIFTKENELLRRFGDRISGRAYGLSLDTRGNLVTLELGRRSDQSYILTYDPSSGEEISRLPYTAHFGKNGSKCRFIDCYNDRLYVADLGASYIYCTALDGGVNILEFGGAGRVPGKFAEPSGISIDANGNLFIGDSRNDRIQIFSSNGTFIGTIKFDYPIKRPSGIHLTADGHLMVMNYLQHYVALFKLM